PGAAVKIAPMTPLDLTRTPNTDPTEIYRYRDGLHAADLLITGIVWLDFFTWLSRNPSDKPAICRALEIADRPTDVMLTLHNAMWTDAFVSQFTASMDCRVGYLAQAMAWQLNLRPYTRLLDIAGGSGIYACLLMAHHPHLQATVFEKPPVDRIAREQIAKRG